MRAWLACGLLCWGCAAPLPVERRDYMLGQVAARFREFYPQGEAGLLEPRFGLPALAKAGERFEVALLERGSPKPPRAQLCAGPRCWPVTLEDRRASSVMVGVEEAKYRARTEAPPGGYDLLLDSERVPRAVWLYEGDPAAPRPLRVVQLNDIHIGKGVAHLDEHLAEVVRDVARLHPDLVIVTGDLSNMGTEASQAPRARALLVGLDAPVVVVPGNHDLGFDSFTRVDYGVGWSNFARSFHASLMGDFVLGGWQFVGFDSGPSTFSPHILTRGILPGAVEKLRQIVAGARALRGVVLFSHAPTRATVTGDGPGPFGRMKWGAAELEQILLDAAARGQRVLHLAGHTHWSDLFEAKDGRFHRWRKLSPCATPIEGRAALITTQAAGHPGVTFKESAFGWGFTELALDDAAPRVTFHRYGLPDDPWVCR
jgi:hypothetical protein